MKLIDAMVIGSAVLVFLVLLVPVAAYLIDKLKRPVRVYVAVAHTDESFEPPTPQEVEDMKGAAKINVDVDVCPRCGDVHEDLEFDRFESHPIGGYTHYGTCPKTGAPILITVGVVSDTPPKAAEVKPCGNAYGQ